MPSPVSHTMAAYSFLIACCPVIVSSRRSHFVAIGLAALLGPMADWDFGIAHFTTHPVLQHHYFSHSIAFAGFFTLVLFLIFRLRSRPDAGRLSLLLGGAYATHLLLDYFTGDGSPPYGIPLLWPLTHEHYRTPVDVFLSIHRGSLQTLFGLRNLLAVLREIAILLPITLLLLWRAHQVAASPATKPLAPLP